MAAAPAFSSSAWRCASARRLAAASPADCADAALTLAAVAVYVQIKPAEGYTFAQAAETVGRVPAFDADRGRFLLRDGALYASPEVEEAAWALARRRLAGEPVAYLIGEWEFYGLPLDISRDVLIPRPDTEVLAEQAIGYIKTLGECRVLDLCAGSGCVGLAVAVHAPQCRVVLGELSEGALRVCKQNVRRNELNARVTCVQADALQKPDAALWDFDVIVCNPPYIPSGDIAGLDASVRDYEPRMALDGGEHGLDYYRAIAPKWKAALRLGGALLFEVGLGQAPAVEDILAQNGYQDIQSAQDTQGIWRVVEGTARD